MNTTAELTLGLERLVAGRRAAAQHLLAAARGAGTPAILAVGSTAARNPDPFSTVDFLLIDHGPNLTLDLQSLAGQPILARVDLPSPRPTRIGLTAIAVRAGPAITWLNLFHWSAATAQIPADSLILYDTTALPYSPDKFDHLVNFRGPQPPYPSTPDSRLRHITDHIKILARATAWRSDEQDRDPDPSDVADGLRRRLTAVDATRLGAAVAATAALIDLAETACSYQWRDRRQAWPPRPPPHDRGPPQAPQMPASYGAALTPPPVDHRRIQRPDSTMDCTSDACDLYPVIAPWAQSVAYLAAIVVVVVMYAREQRQPGAQLRTYISAVRPQLLSPAKPSRRRTAAAIAFLAAVAVLAVVALVLAQQDSRTEVPRTRPVSTLADAQARTRAQLDTIIAALTAVAPDARHDPTRTKIGPTPCGETGPSYYIAAYDIVLLPVGKHQGALAALNTQLQAQGFDTVSLITLPGGATQLSLLSENFSATIGSARGDTSLAITVTSTCMTTPDGKYPG